MRVIAVLGFISTGFLLFMLVTSNPFERYFPGPMDGSDLNPLLQDPGLIIHPPMLYTGYVGFSVAFAFAIGRDDDQRYFTLFRCGPTMVPITIDPMVAGDQNGVAAFPPFHKDCPKEYILLDGLPAILTRIGAICFAGVIHHDRVEQQVSGGKLSYKVCRRGKRFLIRIIIRSVKPSMLNQQFVVIHLLIVDPVKWSAVVQLGDPIVCHGSTIEVSIA